MRWKELEPEMTRSAAARSALKTMKAISIPYRKSGTRQGMLRSRKKPKRLESENRDEEETDDETRLETNEEDSGSSSFKNLQIAACTLSGWFPVRQHVPEKV